MHELGAGQLEGNRTTLKDKAAGTTLAPATMSFADRKTLDLGNLKVELLHYGNAHTPGDLAVWIPARKTLFTGDIAFNERLLAVLPIGSTAGWIQAFDGLAKLPATIWVPGHGRVTSPERSRRDTRDYLAFLRDAAKKVFDAGGSLQDAVEKVDQSRFRSLANYELLASRNMNIVFQEIEKESF
jgi:glyoxylase-like metal-dependent hydrolase (beta-lactamase superfamily II)